MKTEDTMPPGPRAPKATIPQLLDEAGTVLDKAKRKPARRKRD